MLRKIPRIRWTIFHGQINSKKSHKSQTVLLLHLKAIKIIIKIAKWFQIYFILIFHWRESFYPYFHLLFFRRKIFWKETQITLNWIWIWNFKQLQMEKWVSNNFKVTSNLFLWNFQLSFFKYEEVILSSLMNSLSCLKFLNLKYFNWNSNHFQTPFHFH